MKPYDADRTAVLDAARRQGVKAFVSVGIDEETNAACLQLAESNTDIWATAGLHPHSAHLSDDAMISRIEKWAKASKRVVAVGEVGLDYFKSEAPKDKQRETFAAMIGVAHAADLPVVVHSRDAFDDTMQVLEKEGARPGRVVFHCFSYDTAALERALAFGAVLSFTCNVTFPNAKALREAVRIAPLGKFMIETDAPYLAPQAKRGARNEPSYLFYLVDEIARIKGVEASEIERATSETAARFFGLDIH